MHLQSRCTTLCGIEEPYDEAGPELDSPASSYPRY